MRTNLRSALVPSLVLLGCLALPSIASALPPDPGNTCGGNGSCEGEADELDFWNQSADDLTNDLIDAYRDYNQCRQEWGQCELDCIAAHEGILVELCMMQNCNCGGYQSNINYLQSLLTYTLDQAMYAGDVLVMCIEMTSCN